MRRRRRKGGKGTTTWRLGKYWEEAQMMVVGKEDRKKAAEMEKVRSNGEERARTGEDGALGG